MNLQGLKLFKGHQHFTGFTADAWPNDAVLFEQVHQTTGTSKTHTKLALQHGRRAHLAAYN